MRLFLSWKHIISLCFVLLHLSLSIAHATVVPKQHRLLIINSYNEGAPWSQTLINPYYAPNFFNTGPHEFH